MTEININLWLGILCIIAEALATAAYANYLDYIGKCPKLHSYSPKKANVARNMGFTAWITGLVLCVVSIFFVIAEIIILIKPDWLSAINNHLLRGIIYLAKSIATLGISGDLGVAAGSFEIICAFLCIILFVFFCVKGTESFTSTTTTTTKTTVIKKTTTVTE